MRTMVTDRQQCKLLITYISLVLPKPEVFELTTQREGGRGVWLISKQLILPRVAQQLQGKRGPATGHKVAATSMPREIQNQKQLKRTIFNEVQITIATIWFSYTQCRKLNWNSTDPEIAFLIDEFFCSGFLFVKYLSNHYEVCPFVSFCIILYLLYPL